MTDLSSPALLADQQASLALRKLALVALLSIALGFAVQAVILLLILSEASLGAGAVVGVAQGVTWSFLVCSGVSIATSLSKGRPMLAGVLAFLVAPLALAAAKAAQKVMTGWLGAAEKQAVLSLGTISVLRAVEYGLLGWLLGRLVTAGRTGFWTYGGVGALVGIVFGGAITALTWQVAMTDGRPLSTVQLATTGFNEIVFPFGCAVVIYVGQIVGRTLRLTEDTKA